MMLFSYTRYLYEIVYVVSLDKYKVYSCSQARVFRKISEHPQREYIA